MADSDKLRDRVVDYLASLTSDELAALLAEARPSPYPANWATFR
ncbi:hypothetical protein [Mycolicibacillus koreensis]|nr:hypothetical protein [Mycolicibacillus koreensis]BBY52943.1 hypothetical protein MKOR_01940 [Mycolicibacillus koreensis]